MKKILTIGLVIVLLVGVTTLASAKNTDIVITFNIEWDYGDGFGLAKINVNLGGETIHQDVEIPWGLDNFQTYFLIANELGLDVGAYIIDKEVINYNENNDISSGLVKLALAVMPIP